MCQNECLAWQQHLDLRPFPPRFFFSTQKRFWNFGTNASFHFTLRNASSNKRIELSQGKMDETMILRVPPEVAERIRRMMKGDGEGDVSMDFRCHRIYLRIIGWEQFMYPSFRMDSGKCIILKTLWKRSNFSSPLL